MNSQKRNYKLAFGAGSLFGILLIVIQACTKSQLKHTTLTITNPIESSIFQHNDSVFVKGELDYDKEINDIAFFCAIVLDKYDSTIFERTILPVSKPYKINEYYVNKVSEISNATLHYGKRNVKTGQIYELKEIHFKLMP